MSDNKVSRLPLATSIGEDDLLYVVQNSTSKRIPALTVFNNLSNVILNGNVTLGGDTQTLSNAGEVDITKNITLLDIPSGTNIITIPDGRNGQVKILATIASDGIFQITSNVLGSNIIFSETGDSGIFLYTNDSWVCLGTYYADGYST